MTLADFPEIVHALPEPILLVEPRGTIVAANRNAARLFRRRPAEIVGKPLGIFVTEDPEKLARYLRQCWRDPDGISGGFTIRPLAKLPIPCTVMGGLVHHAASSSRLLWLRLLPGGTPNGRCAGYGEQLQTLASENRARQQNEQRWRTAFENSAIGITMADFTGRYFAANTVFLNMLGYTESELYQLTFIDVTHEDDRKANLELVKELEEGKRRHFEIEKRY